MSPLGAIARPAGSTSRLPEVTSDCWPVTGSTRMMRPSGVRAEGVAYAPMSATSRLPSAATTMSYGCRNSSPCAPLREISVSAPVAGLALSTTAEAADCFVTTEFAT